MVDTREPVGAEGHRPKGVGGELGPPEQVQILRDPGLGMVAVVVVHDTRFGPAFGGIRRHDYPDLAAAIADGERLAAAMTAKCAVHGIPGGGGKAVLLAEPRADDLRGAACPPPEESGAPKPRTLDRHGAYRRLGEWVEAMGGRFYTGPDVGTGAEDLAAVAQGTSFVTAPGPEGPGDLAEPTARGVFAGLQATAAQLGWQVGDLEGLHVAIQGLGAVGGRVARHLLQAGARVTVADVDPNAVDAFADASEDPARVQRVEVDRITEVPCDIFAPCALGGVLDGAVVASLPARAVCGGANNQAHEGASLSGLHRRGIWVAPDFVVNSGALVHGALFHLEGAAPPAARIDEIGPLVTDLFAAAARHDISPFQAALDRVRGRLGSRPPAPYLPKR